MFSLMPVAAATVCRNPRGGVAASCLNRSIGSCTAPMVANLGTEYKPPSPGFGTRPTNGIVYPPKVDVKDILAANLRKLFEAVEDERIVGPRAADFTMPRYGISKSTVYRLLDPAHEDYSYPSIDKLERLAAIYDMPAWALLVPGIEPEDRPAVGTIAQLEVRALELMQEMLDARRRLAQEARPGQPGTADPFVAGEATEGQSPATAPTQAQKRTQ